MLRRLLGQSVIYGVTGVFTRGLQIVLLPVYTRFLAPVEYGAFDYLLMVGALANLTVALEISQGLARRYADLSDAGERARYASTALVYTAVSYCAFAALAIVFSRPIAAVLLDSADHAALVRVAAVAIAANGVLALFQDVLRWHLQPWRFALVAFAFAFTSAAVGIYLVVFAGIGVAGIFWGQIAGGGLAGVVCFLLSQQYYRLAFDWQRCREMLAYSAPLVLSGAAVFLNLYVDRIALKALLGLDAVGVYGVGARFAMVVGVLLFGIQSAMTPLVYQHHTDPATPGQIARAFTYFLAGCLAFVLLTAFYPREILWLFTTGPYYGAWPVIAPLALALMLSSTYLFAPGLFLAGKTGWVAGINIGTAALNIALNLVLIPLMGIMGAACATLSAALVAATMYISLGQPRYRVPHDWARIAAGCGMAAVCLSGALAWAHNTGVSYWSALLKLPLYAGSAALVATMLLGRAELAGAFGKLRDQIRPGAPQTRS